MASRTRGADSSAVAAAYNPNSKSSSYTYTSNTSRDGEYKRLSYNLRENNSNLQKNVSTDNVVIRTRGFKPSDRHDPIKRNFLEHLTSKILHFDMAESGGSTPINLQKLLTPASDSNELMHVKNKKMYASSYFYAPTHPTVEDQVELARRISHSLSDVKNMKSKGQTMYVNRKKRSVKWIHDGNGTEGEDESLSPMPKDKVPLKCMMNPNGKVLDIHGIQALGEEVNIEPRPLHPEKLFDIVRDLNNQRGRGAEIFAKRRKRSEKWVVDKEQVQSPTNPDYTKCPAYTGKQVMGYNENNYKFPHMTMHTTPVTQENKPYYSPFNMDIDNINSLSTGYSRQRAYQNVDNGYSRSAEVKKIYLREVAVGTEPEHVTESVQYRDGKYDRSRRMSYDCNESANCCNHNSSGARGYYNNRYSSSNNKLSPNPNPAKLAPNTNVPRNGRNRGKQNPSDSEENEYTPVPVKQLIQEFEKTCRPVMQYKKLSPKMVPMVQQSQSDISRFFECRGVSKYQESCRRPERHHETYDEPIFERYGNKDYSSFQDEEDGEDEDDDDLSLDDSLSPVDLYRMDVHCKGQQMNQDHESRMVSMEDYYRQLAVTNGQCNNGGGERRNVAKYTNGDAYSASEAKSRMLATVTSEDDILDTLKRLRNTPVLENLVPGASPDYKIVNEGPSQMDVDKPSESTYHGPKISSYQNLANYNTAPRGWDQSLSYYRPVKFEKPQEPIAYSDF